jgi:hypothetical protein
LTAVAFGLVQRKPTGRGFPGRPDATALTEKGEIMQTANLVDERLWKRCLQDALFELEAEALREKVEAAVKAIEMRRVELIRSANPDSGELAELMDGLNALRALGFLKESNGAVELR